MSSTLPAAAAFTGSTVTEGQFKQAITDQRTFLNDPDSYQWYAPGLAPTYVSTVSFTLVGDQTAAFHAGRRFKAIVTAGTVYGRIAKSVFTTLTTLTVILDSGSLDSGLSTVYLGVPTVLNPGTPPGMEKIDSKTASGSASIDFTNISNTLYDSYLVVCDNVIPATNATTLRAQIALGGVFQTGAIYTHNHFRFTAAGSGIDGSISDTSACISSSAEALGTGASQVFYGEVNISNCSQATQEKRWKSHSSYVSSGANNIVDVGGGRFVTTSAIDGFRFLMSAGNIASGTFTLYGLRK